MDNQLHSIFDAMTPTDTQVKHIYTTIKSKESAPTMVLKKRKALPLLAAVVAVAITTVAAVSVLSLSDGSLHFLSQFSSKEQAYWEDGAFVVNQSVTCDSGTVVVKEVMGDDATTLIFLDFIAPEGQVLDKELYDFDWRDVSTKYDTLMYGFDPMDDPDPTDNVVPFVFSITTEGSLAGSKIQLKLQDCIGADDWDYLDAYSDLRYNQQHREVEKGADQTVIVEDAQPIITTSQSTSTQRELSMTEEEILSGVTLFEGAWDFDFKADYKTFATTYKPKLDIAYEGTQVRWDRVSVSPISLRIWASFDVDDEEAIDSFSDQLRTFTVHYQDGTVTEVDGASGSIDYSTGEIQSTLDYTQLDLDQPITAVTYLGETYPFS